MFIPLFIVAWVVYKGCQALVRSTRAGVADWWDRAEARARTWRNKRGPKGRRDGWSWLAGALAGIPLWLGRVGYHTTRSGARAFGSGVREGWRTRDQARQTAYRWGQALTDRLRRRSEGQNSGRGGPAGASPGPDAAPQPGAAPGPGQPAGPETAGPGQPGAGRAAGGGAGGWVPPAEDDLPWPPPFPPEPDPAPGPPDPGGIQPVGRPALDSPPVIHLDPDPGEYGGKQPAAVSYRLSMKEDATMTQPTPVAADANAAGPGDITGIDSTRIQLGAMGSVLTALVGAAETMHASLGEYQLDDETLGDVMDLFDQINNAAAKCEATVTALGDRHGGIEDAVKSAPVKAAKTEFYEE